MALPTDPNVISTRSIDATALSCVPRSAPRRPRRFPRASQVARGAASRALGATLGGFSAHNLMLFVCACTVSQAGRRRHRQRERVATLMQREAQRPSRPRVRGAGPAPPLLRASAPLHAPVVTHALHCQGHVMRLCPGRPACEPRTLQLGAAHNTHTPRRTWHKTHLPLSEDAHARRPRAAPATHADEKAPLGACYVVAPAARRREQRKLCVRARRLLYSLGCTLVPMSWQRLGPI